ncbi:MAG: sugar ABC transporter permease [Bacilli bacterium]|nr:sugar ABC transporter permease [Bacilli bacterium]
MKKQYIDEPVKGIKKLFIPLIIIYRMFLDFIADKLYSLEVKIHQAYRKRFPEKRTLIKKKRKKELIFFICLVAYPVLQFLVFYVFVNINSILLSFKKFDTETATYFYVGLENFKNFLRDITQDYGMITAVKNSVKLYLATVLIALPLNLVFSFFLYKKVPGANSFRTVLFLPQIISSLVISLMFRYFVENALASIIGVNLLQNKSSGFNTIIFFCIWASFGTQILMYTNAMSKISKELVEVGQLEGMSLFQEFWHVTLPSIYPTIVVFLVAGVASLFTHQAGLYNFYGPSARQDLQTLGYIFFVKIVRNNDAAFAQYPYASAAGLLFTVVAATITLTVKHLLEKYGPRED